MASPGDSIREYGRGSRYRWIVVAMLWSICFFNYADRQAVFSVFPLLEREMHLSPVEPGRLGSAFAWVYGLGAPLAGWIADRVRRKTAILGGLHAWSIICMAAALSRNIRHLLLLRAAEGSGETFYYPASSPWRGSMPLCLRRSPAWRPAPWSGSQGSATRSRDCYWSPPGSHRGGKTSDRLFAYRKTGAPQERGSHGQKLDFLLLVSSPDHFAADCQRRTVPGVQRIAVLVFGHA